MSESIRRKVQERVHVEAVMLQLPCTWGTVATMFSSVKREVCDFGECDGRSKGRWDERY